MGLRSGLWLEPKTFDFPFWSHIFVEFGICFESSSCWNVKFLFIFSHLTEDRRFCIIHSWDLELFYFQSTLTSAPVEENQPQSIMLPPIMLNCLYGVPWMMLCNAPNISFRVKAKRFNMVWGDWMSLLAAFRCVCILFYMRNGCCLATTPHSPDFCRIRKMPVVPSVLPTLWKGVKTKV